MQDPSTPVAGLPEIRLPLEPGNWEVGDVVQYDPVAMASRPCPPWTKCQGYHAMAILEAKRKPPIFGQVIEVTDGHVDVIWENERWASYGNHPWLGPLEALS